MIAPDTVEHVGAGAEPRLTGDSRSLAALHSTVRAMALELLDRCAAAGAPLTVTCTYRSPQTQAALFAQGRTRPGKRVTNAPAGHSYHNFGLALDVVPTELLALPRWGDTPGHQERTHALWTVVGVTAKALGFCWRGDFRTFRTDRICNGLADSVSSNCARVIALWSFKLEKENDMNFFKLIRSTVFAVAPAALISTPASAGSQTGQISFSSADQAYSTQGLITLRVTGSATGRPGCATDNRWALNIANGKAANSYLYGLALTAMANGWTVTVGGTGTCSAINFIEDISYIEVAK